MQRIPACQKNRAKFVVEQLVPKAARQPQQPQPKHPLHPVAPEMKPALERFMKRNPLKGTVEPMGAEEWISIMEKYSSLCRLRITKRLPKLLIC